MPQVPLSEIPENARLVPARAMELAHLSRSAMLARLVPGHPREFTWAMAPNAPPYGTGHGPKLIKVIDARSLPPEAIERWQQSLLAGAFIMPQPLVAKPQELAAANAPAQQLRLLALSPALIEQEHVIDQWLPKIAECGNGAHAKYGLSKSEFVTGVAREMGCSPATIYRRVAAFKQDGIRALVNGTPGPAPAGAGSEVFGKPQNAWMKAHLADNYRAGNSKSKCHRLLLKEIETRQPLHPEHRYDRPSEFQSVTYLRSLPPINKIARQGGAPAIKVAAGYMDRSFENEAAGDCWCIDEWQVDAHLYLDWKVAEVVRPFIITTIDERSEAILGWRLVVRPNAHAVLDLTEEILRKCWRPLRWYSDRGGHFRAKIGKHYAEVPKLLDKAAGALGRIGIQHQAPRAKNPRGNRIERKVHGFYAAKALECLAGSACGCAPERAEALGVYERVKHHKTLCISGDVRETQLLSYKQLRAMIPDWIAEYNATPSEANDLKGLTPEAAFKRFSPAPEVIQDRLVDPVELAVKFAEPFDGRKIREGGIVDLGEKDGERFRYYSPLLTRHAGITATVTRFRHWRSFVAVKFNDGVRDMTVIADRRVRVGIGDADAVARAQEERARVEKYLQGQYAPRVQVRGHLAPLQPEEPTIEHEISSSEFMMRRGKPPALQPVTSEEVAFRALEMEMRG